MILMEGLMSVPPERGTIIGRALWKSRYVVLRTGAHLKTQTDILSESSGRSSTRKGLKSTPSKPNLVELEQGQDPRLYLSIYKAKGDWEFIAQHPISIFKTCEIRTLQHRKQGGSFPTLLLEMKTEAIIDTQRKRKPSMTAGLTSKDPWANVMLFRTMSEERYSIYDWQTLIKTKLTSETSEDGPLTPPSPSFSTFTNPFQPRDSSNSSRPDMSQRSSSHPVTTNPLHGPGRDRPSNLISPSPSLRSRRSDLSSQSSSLHPPIGFSSHLKSYPTTLPPDLPSPASTYEVQFIEGWTAAQGRSSALSSHTRGSNSIASAVAPKSPMVSTPPKPRETILDRAFQMRYIPGSERAGDIEEEKFSSIARFEALMKEVDERKKQKELVGQAGSRNRQGWYLDEESEESDSGEEEEVGIPTAAQRALDYITGRGLPPSSIRPLSPAPRTRSPPIPFLNSQASHSGSSSSIGIRPRAGTASSHRHTRRPNSMALPSRSMSTATIPTLKDIMTGNGNLKSIAADDSGKENRRSSTTVKRLSFQEFTKPLSSTSSLSLVHTNASSSIGRDGSRRTSSEYGFEYEVGPRGPGFGSEITRDKRFGWRGSMGVFGGEGGFL